MPKDDDYNDDNTDITIAHYLPVEPRTPASSALSSSDGVPVEPRVLAASSSPNQPTRPVTESSQPARSIAELFQDMLRQAFAAGVAAAGKGETFETWYQREVLR